MNQLTLLTSDNKTHSAIQSASLWLHSADDVDRSSKRQRKKMLKKMSTQCSATEDNSDDEQIELEIRQQIESVDVPTSLPDKAVCIQIHTGNIWQQV